MPKPTPIESALSNLRAAVNRTEKTGAQLRALQKFIASQPATVREGAKAVLDALNERPRK